MGKQIKGILGTKLGMTQVFNDAGQIVPVTFSDIFWTIIHNPYFFYSYPSHNNLIWPFSD